MIRIDINETFPLTVELIDENTGLVVSGEDVFYDVRKQPGDTELSPALNGQLTESTVASGIYNTLLDIDESGSYVAYITCDTFPSNTVEIIVNSENIYDLVKQNRHYNISVEDVIRTNTVATASQTTRNVPLGRTDYVITKIKHNSDSNWSGAGVVEGRVYAWYRTITSTIPYKMGGSS